MLGSVITSATEAYNFHSLVQESDDNWNIRGHPGGRGDDHAEGDGQSGEVMMNPICWKDGNAPLRVLGGMREFVLSP